MSKDKAPPSSESTEPIRFEDAIDQVERIVDKIESGQGGLEQSLVDYERATKLIGHCRSILTVAQKRIAELTCDAQGQLQVVNPGHQEVSGDV